MTGRSERATASLTRPARRKRLKTAAAAKSANSARFMCDRRRESAPPCDGKPHHTSKLEARRWVGVGRTRSPGGGTTTFGLFEAAARGRPNADRFRRLVKPREDSRSGSAQPRLAGSSDIARFIPFPAEKVKQSQPTPAGESPARAINGEYSSSICALARQQGPETPAHPALKRRRSVGPITSGGRRSSQRTAGSLAKVDGPAAHHTP